MRVLPLWKCIGRGLVLLITLHPAAHAAGTPVIDIDAEDAAAPWSQADGAGAANEIVREAFARSGVPVRLHTVPYARCKAEMLAGSVVGCIAVGANEALGTRARLPRTPLYRVRTVLVSREHAPIGSCDAHTWPASATVGRVNAYEYAPRFEQALAATRVSVSELGSEPQGLRMLVAGRIDALVLQLDSLKTLDYVQRQAGAQAPLQVACDFGPLDSHIGFSVRHRDGALALAAFEQGYAAMLADGSVERILDAWRERLLKSPSPPR